MSDDPVTTWLAAAPPTARALDAKIRAAAPDLLRTVDGVFLSYGAFDYRYESGRTGRSALVGMAVRKAGVAVYVNSVRADGTYVPEAHAAKLGKVKVGKSCITVPTVEKLDAATFDAVIREALALGGAAAVKDG